MWFSLHDQSTQLLSWLWKLRVCIFYYALEKHTMPFRATTMDHGSADWRPITLWTFLLPYAVTLGKFILLLSTHCFGPCSYLYNICGLLSLPSFQCNADMDWSKWSMKHTCSIPYEGFPSTNVGSKWDVLMYTTGTTVTDREQIMTSWMGSDQCMP